MEWRKLHARIIESATFNDLPDDTTRLFWVLLTLVIDSAGRIPNHPALLRSKCFPCRIDITLEQIALAVERLAEQGMIELYEVDGRQYLQATNWRQYQRCDRESPSRLPPPPHSGVGPEQVRSNSGVGPEQVESYSRSDIDIDEDEDQMDMKTKNEDDPLPYLIWSRFVHEFPAAAHDDASRARLRQAALDYDADELDSAVTQALAATKTNRPHHPLAYFWTCVDHALNANGGSHE